MTTVWIPLFDVQVCTACGDCIAACPTDALMLFNGVAAVKEAEACNYCGVCEEICPVEAVTLPYQIVLGSDL